MYRETTTYTSPKTSNLCTNPSQHQSCIRILHQLSQHITVLYQTYAWYQVILKTMPIICLTAIFTTFTCSNLIMCLPMIITEHLTVYLSVNGTEAHMVKKNFPEVFWNQTALH